MRVESPGLENSERSPAKSWPPCPSHGQLLTIQTSHLQERPRTREDEREAAGQEFPGAQVGLVCTALACAREDRPMNVSARPHSSADPTNHTPSQAHGVPLRTSPQDLIRNGSLLSELPQG